MESTKRMLCLVLGLGLLAGLTSGAAGKTVAATQINLDAALNQSTKLADKKQTAYLRVGLTGFALENDQERPPVNIAIVIDKSGSMSGEKIAKAREAAIMAISRLRSDDIISVVTYDSTVNVLVPATKATDKESIFQRIRRVNSGGSTALFAGVSKGAEELRKFLVDSRVQRVNRMVLLSDGLANVGPQSPDELGSLGSSLIKDGISVTTIGLGGGYNEDLMTKLAYNSDGSHYFAEQASDLARVFDDEFGRALSVVAQEITTEINCFPGIRPIRVMGRDAEISGQSVRVFINHLYSRREKYILLEVEVPATSERHKRDIAAVTVWYNNLKTHTTDNLTSKLEANFSRSADLVKKHTNAKVMADVVEMIATEQNELAIKYRDEGQIEEARQILETNEQYLMDNSVLFSSPKLKDYAKQNREDAAYIEKDEEWKVQRKRMRSIQSGNKRQ